MTLNQQDRMTRLCSQIQEESDPAQFLQLVNELVRVLNSEKQGTPAKPMSGIDVR